MYSSKKQLPYIFVTFGYYIIAECIVIVSMSVTSASVRPSVRLPVRLSRSFLETIEKKTAQLIDTKFSIHIDIHFILFKFVDRQYWFSQFCTKELFNGSFGRFVYFTLR